MIGRLLAGWLRRCKASGSGPAGQDAISPGRIRRQGCSFPAMAPPPPKTITLANGTAHLEWRRNASARSISLRVNPVRGTVVLTLPTWASREAGVDLLMRNLDWLDRRISRLPEPVTFADGSVIPIGGEPHTIRHIPKARGGAWLEANELHVTGDPEFIHRRVRDFLRAEAARRLAAMVNGKARAIGRMPRRITVKDTVSRWGSCSADGSLAFSWRLVMAPQFVQDYVAAHEVAHLAHMNHSPAFWSQVRALTDHTDQAIAWLKVHGPGLLRIG